MSIVVNPEIACDSGGACDGVGTLNGISGPIELVAGSGITITPSGQDITISSTGGGGGADTQLSNLDPPTLIPINLNFAPGLQNATLQTPDTAAASPSKNIIVKSGNNTGGTTGSLTLVTGNATGASGSVLIHPGTAATSGGQLSVSAGTTSSATGNAGTANLAGGAISNGSGTGSAGSVNISGGSNAGGGAGGNITLLPSSGTPTGQIRFQNSNEGTPGDVWTSTGALGEGTWQTPSGLINPMPNNIALNWRNAANTADIPGINIDGGDNIVIGDPGTSARTSLQMQINTSFFQTDFVTLLGQSQSSVLQFWDAAGNNYVAFRAPTTLASTTNYAWPSVDGVAGGALVTDGAGGLSFFTGATGTFQSGDLVQKTITVVNGLITSIA